MSSEERFVNVNVIMCNDSVSSEDFLNAAVQAISHISKECFDDKCNDSLHFLDSPELVMKFTTNMTLK